MILLRRTKTQTNDAGARIIELPPRTINIVRLKFTQEEQALYVSLFSKARDRIESLLHSGSVLEHYAHVLLMLLRLRQVRGPPSSSSSSCFLFFFLFLFLFPFLFFLSLHFLFVCLFHRTLWDTVQSAQFSPIAVLPQTQSSTEHSTQDVAH